MGYNFGISADSSDPLSADVAKAFALLYGTPMAGGGGLNAAPAAKSAPGMDAGGGFPYSDNNWYFDQAAGSLMKLAGANTAGGALMSGGKEGLAGSLMGGGAAGGMSL